MLTEEQREAILKDSATGYFQGPACRLPGPRKKYTTAQRKRRKTTKKLSTASKARNRPKGLSKRKKAKALHKRKKR